MKISTEYQDRAGDITALFKGVFTASEGPEEGNLIGAFVAELLASTAPEDLRVFSAWDDGTPIACICFSRLTYPEDGRMVFLLSPVAVATDRQGQGIGQALLRQGLDALRAEGVEGTITYGDPDYYGKVGYRPLTEAEAQPPLPLTHPEGWIGQSLSTADLFPLRGPSRCVAALDNPDLW